MVSANTAYQYLQLKKESGLTTEQINQLYRTLNLQLSLPHNLIWAEGPATHGKAWEEWFDRYLDPATLQELWGPDKQVVWRLPDDSATIKYFLRASTLNAACLIRKRLREALPEAAGSGTVRSDRPRNDDTHDSDPEEENTEAEQIAHAAERDPLSCLSQSERSLLIRKIRSQLEYPQNKTGLAGPGSEFGWHQIKWNSWFNSYIHSGIADEFWGPEKQGEFQFPRDEKLITPPLRRLVKRVASSIRNWSRKRKLGKVTNASMPEEESDHALSETRNGSDSNSDTGRMRDIHQRSMSTIFSPARAPTSIIPFTASGKRFVPEASSSTMGRMEKRPKLVEYWPGEESPQTQQAEAKIQVRGPTTSTIHSSPHYRENQSTSRADTRTLDSHARDTAAPGWHGLSSHRAISPLLTMPTRPPDTFITRLYYSGNKFVRKELIEVAGLISLPTFLRLFRARHGMDLSLQIQDMELKVGGRRIVVDLDGPEGEHDWGLALGILYFSGVPERERLSVRVRAE